MQWNKMLGNDPHLLGLIQKAQYFQSLNEKLKALFPENLAAHFRVVCIENGTLILHVSGNMAASRLKMLLPMSLPRIQQLDEKIIDVKIKVVPIKEKPNKIKHFEINQAAVQRFAQTAKQVQHHAGLSQALWNLVKHHDKNQ